MRDDDKHHFEQAARRYWTPLLRTARRKLPTLELAEDYVAETYLRLWGAYARERGPARGREWAWLRVVLKFVIADHYKREKVRPERNSTEEGPAHPDSSPVANAVADDVWAKIQEKMAGWSALRREVFRLHLLGYEPREIAAILNLSAGAVSMHLFRARKDIRDLLDEESEPDEDDEDEDPGEDGDGGDDDEG